MLKRIENPCCTCSPKMCNFNEPTDTCEIFKKYLNQLEEQCKKCKESTWGECIGQCITAN